MSYQKWREDFIGRIVREGATVGDARRLMRYAATLERLAVAQCNGDYPADNGERPVRECSECGQHWARSAFDRAWLCVDCRTTARARAYVAEALPGWRVRFNGDPRGCVVAVYPPSMAGRDMDQDHGIGVPSRS